MGELKKVPEFALETDCHLELIGEISVIQEKTPRVVTSDSKLAGQSFIF